MGAENAFLKGIQKGFSVGDKTKIAWADATWNPVTGCSKISPACVNCYAERDSQRMRGRFGYPGDDPFRVTLHKARLENPLRWKKPRRIFVCSMGDLFHESVPKEYIAAVFGVMAAASQHTFMLLTKRPIRMREWFKWIELRVCPGVSLYDHAEDLDLELHRNDIPRWPLPNVWIGVTAEDQRHAEMRIPVLLDVPAEVRFVSVEPMLGPVNVERWLEVGATDTGPPYVADIPRLDWVICGGESGSNARPMHPEWVCNLRDQCVEAGVPYMFKQWGEWAPRGGYGVFEGSLPEDDGVRVKIGLDGRNTSTDQTVAAVPGGGTDDNPIWVGRFGRNFTGRIIEGREWHQFPEPTP